jgi:Predicted membrane protein (DUF2142)
VNRTETALSRPGRFRLIFIAPALLLIALMCWAVASPIGASPDDDFHLASIWCAQGVRPGLCEAVPGHPAERAVPREVSLAGRCFKTKPAQSAACIAPAVGNPNALVATKRGNFSATSYPPVYYAVMSVFVTHNVSVSVVLMRVINALLFTVIVSLLFLFLPLRRRATLVWAWAVSILPLGAFLIASNNPSSWAIIAGGTLWLSLVGYFETTGRRRIGLGVLSGVLAAMGAGARSDAAVYAVIAVVVAALLTARRTRSYLLASILPAAIVVFSILMYLSARQSGVSSGGFSGNALPTGVSKLGLIGMDLLEVPSLWAGSLGTWGLGWLDTAMPAIVWMTCIVCFGAITYAGLRSYTVRKIIAVVLVFAALWAIPTWVLVQSKATVGESVQPRYVYPLLIMLAGVALLQVTSSRFRLNRPQLIFVVAALSIANAVALHVNIRRYVTGLDVFGFNLNHNVEWWWHAPISPMLIWFVGSVVFAGALVIVVREISRREPIAAKSSAEPAPPYAETPQPQSSLPPQQQNVVVHEPAG